MKRDKIYALISFLAIISLITINNLIHTPAPVPAGTPKPTYQKKSSVTTDKHGNLLFYTDDHSVNIL